MQQIRHRSHRTCPNEVYLGRLPHLPLSAFDFPNIGDTKILNRDQLASTNLATAPQQRVYRAVRELHAIYVLHIDSRNVPLMYALRLLPRLSVNGWAWIYNSAAPTPDAIVRKTKLSINWIGHFKILAVGPAPASAVPDGRPLHNKLLSFDLPSDMPGRDSKPPVSVVC